MTEHTPVPYGYFKSQESRLFQAETWAITGPEHDHEESWDIVADGIADEATARFIVTACNCHADLLKALKKISSMRADCSRLATAQRIANGAIRKAEEMI